MGVIFFLLQVSKVTTGTNKKKLMRKLPDFIYNEEKALEINTFIWILHYKLSTKSPQVPFLLSSFNSLDLMMLFMISQILFFAYLHCLLHIELIIIYDIYCEFHNL